MTQACLDNLLTVIDALHLKEGDRLPSERCLAEKLAVSRNTVRETLAALAARGEIEIRGRSGCYLRNKAGPSWVSLRKKGSPEDALSALSIVAPQMAMRAAAACNADIARNLESLTAMLGRSLVNRDGARTAQIFFRFFDVLGGVAGNPYFVLLLREISASDRLLTTLHELEKPLIDAFFPLHVGLLQAIQNGDSERAGVLAAHCLEAFSALLGFPAERTRRGGVPL